MWEKTEVDTEIIIRTKATVNASLLFQKNSDPLDKPINQKPETRNYCIIKSTVHSPITSFNLDLNFTIVNSYRFFLFLFFVFCFFSNLTRFCYVPVLVGEFVSS